MNNVYNEVINDLNSLQDSDKNIAKIREVLVEKKQKYSSLEDYVCVLAAFYNYMSVDVITYDVLIKYCKDVFINVFNEDGLSNHLNVIKENDAVLDLIINICDQNILDKLLEISKTDDKFYNKVLEYFKKNNKEISIESSFEPQIDISNINNEEEKAYKTFINDAIILSKDMKESIDGNNKLASITNSRLSRLIKNMLQKLQLNTSSLMVDKLQIKDNIKGMIEPQRIASCAKDIILCVSSKSNVKRLVSDSVVPIINSTEETIKSIFNESSLVYNDSDSINTIAIK
ncbi:MAG: hypothetical protein IJ094_10680 [Bacilli bacterium]|nr:hypothetical protein [Bacilli bacterium]